MHTQKDKYMGCAMGCGFFIYILLCLAYPFLWVGLLLFLIIRWLIKMDEKNNENNDEKELVPIDLLQNERFSNLLKLVFDTPDIKLPLDQSTIEKVCDELKQDGIEITTSKLQEYIGAGLAQYVIQEYVRVRLSDIVWPKRYGISDRGLDGLYILLEQKGIIIPKLRLQQLANTEVLRQERERFKESFYHFKPELRGGQNILRVVAGYVDIFGESYQEQLDYFLWFMNEEFANNKPFTQTDLMKLIQDEIKKRADLRMAEHIRSAIKTGYVNQKRIQIEDIDRMEGHEFEHFLQKLFSAMGYKVEVTKASGDQGADLLAEKFGSKIAIQAKRYTGPVGNKAVQEVIGAMQYYKCDKGIVVTNSTFTKSASELAWSSNVELIDRHELIKLIDKYGMGIEAPEW